MINQMQNDDVRPEDVSFPWRCPEADKKCLSQTAEWSYVDLVNSGTPVCGNCGGDMVLDN